MEQALSGRAAWGVLGSAAGGHVFVLQTETQRLERSFGESCGNSWRFRDVSAVVKSQVRASVRVT